MFEFFGDLQKKTGRYLLQRYLGQFLEEKLNLEQLNINLYNGKGTVNDVSLNCKAINELCETQGWGVEVTGGRLGAVTVTIPWNALMTDDSEIEVTNLYISLKPKPRETDGASMLESMWSSVSSSMQLAQECLEKEGTGAENEYVQLNAQNPIEGLEKFAQTIDNILKRIKAKFLKTEVRLEYLPPNSNKGIAVIVKIDYLNYQNEACNDPSENQDSDVYYNSDDTEADRQQQSQGQKTHLISTYSTHHITIEGITINTEEFQIDDKNESMGGNASKSADSSGVDSSAASLVTSNQFYSVIYNNVPDTEQNPSDESEKSNDSETEREESDCEGGAADNFNDSLTDIHSNDSIPVIRIDGTQDVRIKMKQADNISGPKVTLDIQIGAIFIFLSPRQLHLITNFYEVFFTDPQPNNAMSTTVAPQKQAVDEKKQFINSFGGGGWSEPLENTKLMGSAGGIPTTSSTKNTNTSKYPFDYCESLSSSMTSSSTTTTTCSSKFLRKAATLDMNGDISNFNIRIASVNSILLHEDILIESSTSNKLPLSEESVRNLLELSNYFFSCIEGNFIHNFICKNNYLKLNLSPIIADGIQQRNNNNIFMKFSIAITKVDFDEILEEIAHPVIVFDRKENCSNGMHKRPEITINIKNSTPANIYNLSRRKVSPPRTDICLILEVCSVELDISIYDRLSAIFSATPFSQELQPPPQTNSQMASFHQPVVEFKIDAPILNLHLRFPIADCRPVHDPNRVPWWKQNIRPDYLLFVFYQFRLTVLSSLIEILSNELDVFYCESSSSPKVHIAKSNLVNNSDKSSHDEIEYPKITIEFPSEKKLQINLQCLAEGSDSGETSGEGCDLYKHKSKINLPFSSKRVCRESDTPHSKKGPDETETVLLPGEKVELLRFCDRTMNTSKMQIKVHLPVASLQINSKHLYETIYNRLNTDLLMWESCSPLFENTVPKSTNTALPKSNNDQSLFNIGMMDSMYVPSSGQSNSTQYDDVFGSGSFRNDENNSGLSDCETEGLFYSTYERKRSKRSQSTSVSLCPSACGFELTVTKGILDISTPVRDIENRVLPGQSGEFLIKVEQFSFNSVNGFNGNENLGYLCLQSKAVEVYHCGLLPYSQDTNPKLRDFNAHMPTYMKSTLYPTPDDLTKGELCDENPKREMLSLVIEIKKNQEQKIKRIRLTTGIQKAALRYHSLISQHSWLTQLLDFVDVTDYPIEGYKPFGIITEMQLHLWDCAVDYRPKYLNYRAVLEIGSLMLSSNIITTVSGCTLRFVPEECVLSLAPYDNVKKYQNDNVVSALPSKELVPVIDIGLFDISLRLNDKPTEIFPKFDLRASIQDVHIRTCSDSGRALAQLISYFASDGDFQNFNESEDGCSMTTSHTSSIYSDADLLSMKDGNTNAPEISPEQQERVNLLMAEAVQETVRSSKTKSASSSGDELEIRYDERGVEVFFFPDEASASEKILRDTSPSSLGSEKFTPNKLQQRTTSDEWGFKSRRDSESCNDLRDLLNFETSVMERSYMGCVEDEDDEVVEALPQIREDLGVIAPPSTNIQTTHRRRSYDFDDDFCVIAEEERAAMTKCGIKNVKLSDDPLRIVDNHFTLPMGKPDLLKAPENFPMAVMRYTLCEMTLTWHIYGGNDFIPPGDMNNEKDKENIKPSRTHHMSDAYKQGVSFSKSQNNITFGKKPIEKLSWKTKGGQNRNHDVLIEIQLTKVKLSHEEYPVYTSQASRQVLIVSELEIRDRLQESDINKFLHHPVGKVVPNKNSKHMIVIKALHVRPNPHRSNTQECSLRVSLLPMRIHIDQDTLLFFVQFFNEVGETSSESTSDKRSSSTQAPVMMVDDIPEAMQDLQARKLVSTNIDLLIDEEKGSIYSKEEDDTASTKDSKSTISSSDTVIDTSPIYFKEIVFSPEVLIRLDYVGRRIELSRGPVAGFLMGLGQLQCSEIRLKEICHRHGILGVDKLFTFLFNEWLQDIKKNQLPAILRGVGPTYTIFQFFQGIRDLFWIPIEQYRKDGRIGRGLQLGAQSFTARTALAALEITSRIIQLLQLTAETAFDMVSPGPSVRSRRNPKKGKRKRPHRPQDIREGVSNAYEILKDGINERANTLYETAITEHDQKGYTGAVGAVFRQIPPIVVCPVVLVTQATTNILGGVKNQLVPDAKFEAREKWKDDSD